MLATTAANAANAAADNTNAPAPARNPGVPEDYQLVFSDEFDGPRLDTTKWWTRYVYNGGMLDRFNDEHQRYRENNNHVFTNGALSLVARETKAVEGDPAPRFESGLIRSKQTYKYGYFEARMKVPGAKGVWPAFWLCGDTAADGVASWPPEIDILELAINGGGDDIPSRYHVNAITRPKDGNNPWDGAQIFKTPDLHGNGSGGYLRADYDFPDDYHIYACLWDTDDTVTWLLDGRKFLIIKYNWLDKNGAEPPWPSVILNLAVGGAWPGRNGIDAAAFPQSLDIDYVRVWQKPGARNIRDTVVGKDLIYVEPCTPYPDAADETAWPGKGPIRVFDFMRPIRERYHYNRKADENAFVIIGDSLIEGFADLPKHFPKTKTANRGLGGDTSRGVLFRFPLEALALNPRGVMICAGINDLTAHADPAHAISNIRDMLALAAAHDKRLPIILCTIPMSSQPDAPIKPGARELLNEGLRRLAAEHENATLLDLEKALQNPDGTQNLDFYASNRLHLGPKGYDAWAALLAPLLEKIPAPKSP